MEQQMATTPTPTGTTPQQQGQTTKAPQQAGGTTPAKPILRDWAEI
jgi:hypothetical protein